MKIGLKPPVKATDGHVTSPQHFDRFVRRAEEYGFGGVWFPEHLTQPSSYQTSYFDPLTALAMAAGMTETIGLGTSVLLLPLRNPVLVAKRAATIQYLSGERLTLGLGLGYQEGEFDAVNVPYQERSKRFTEGLELVRRLLHEDEVTFDGEFFSVEEFRLEPELSQPPRILIGGGGKEIDGEWKILRKVKERLLFADGWIASSNAKVERDWEVLSSFLDAKGRNPDAYDKVANDSVYLVPNEDRETAERKQKAKFTSYVGTERGVEYVEENFLLGSPEDIVAGFQRYEDQGFDELVLNTPVTAPSELFWQLDLLRDRILDEFR